MLQIIAPLTKLHNEPIMAHIFTLLDINGTQENKITAHLCFQLRHSTSRFRSYVGTVQCFEMWNVFGFLVGCLGG